MIEVFWFSTDLSAARLEPLERLLGIHPERGRANRFRFERDRGRFVAARGRLRAVLGCYAKLPPELLTFKIGPYGKPALARVSGEHRVQFSLSHSYGVGVVAVGLEDELGIDIERLRPFDDALAIAERLFTAEEQRALRALPDAARARRVPQALDREGSGGQVAGSRFVSTARRFGLRLDGPGAQRVDVVCDGVSVARWVSSVPPLRQGFVATLAAAGRPPGVRCLEWFEKEWD